MKIFIAVIIAFLCFFSPVICYAISDPLKLPNNKFGIHLLSPEEIVLAAKLVNTSGGDWGYVTIPIQSVDKDLDKWQKFMDKAAALHLIPIIRLMTYPHESHWEIPTLEDSVDFGNFLNSLYWPTKNRYVVFYNEPNRAEEWGQIVDPAGYAEVLDKSIDIFKQKSPDFFILNAGFDAAAPTNHIFMDIYSYINSMESAVPGIFNKLDGWSSHSYPNPDFSASPWEKRKNTIFGYQYEINYLKNYLGVKDLPVFITETGWRHDNKPIQIISSFYEEAFTKSWQDEQIVAITPFLLTAGDGPFQKFSFINKNGEPNEIFNKVASLPKISGKPFLAGKPVKNLVTVNNKKLEKLSFDQKIIDRSDNLTLKMWKEIFQWLFVRQT